MNQPNKKQLNQLADKWLKGTITPEEKELLDQWYDTDSVEPIKWSGADASEEDLSERLLSDIQYKKGTSYNKPKKRWYFPAAAVALIALGLGAYYYTSFYRSSPIVKQPIAKNKIREDAAPGGNKAVLILSNGKEINLSSAQNGQLAKEANTIINKTSDGKVIYEASKNNTIQLTQVQYNMLKTPRGGKYDLTLSDGTRVWLNAASSIKYPSTFTGNVRQVEITGEVYFEVKHNPLQPFRVIASGQTVEDLGTDFNVNAYDDEPAIKTTLIAGSIKISNTGHSAILKPGEQALIQAGQNNQAIALNPNVDIEEAVAWHKGLFKFHDADIQAVMRQLSRWYDVDVSYEGEIPKRLFSGKIYRDITALSVADILSYKKIHFRIEGKKIIVTP